MNTHNQQQTGERTPACVKAQLLHALTEYDRKQSTKASYNRFALGIYMQRLDEVISDLEAGANLREAITAGFTGRLLDTCLKAVGLTKSTDQEQRCNGSWFYVPASHQKA